MEQPDTRPLGVEKAASSENLHKRILRAMESAQIRTSIGRIQSHLSQGDYYSKTISRRLDETSVNFGDYGNKAMFHQDYLLNSIFNVLGSKDAQGQALTVDAVRVLAQESEDDRPGLEVPCKSGGMIDLHFFAGKENINFRTQLRGFSKETLDKVAANPEQLPARKWAAEVVQQLSENQGSILEQNGTFILTLPDWRSPNLNADLTYFLNNYQFGPFWGWEPSEVESLLNGEADFRERGGVVELADSAGGEKWQKFPTRALKGVSLALCRSESGTQIRLLVDTEVLRGRDSENQFIKSQTARDILGVFERLGLEPSDEMLNDFSEGFLGYGHYEPRYGNGYADLSRLVTYVLRESKDIARLFAKGGANVNPDDLIKKSQAVSRPAKLIIDMIRAITQKPPEDLGRSKASFSGSSIRDGACKDSEVYFSGAIGLGKAFFIDNFVSKSGYGSDTKINTIPLQAAGFEFKKGYLFRVGPKGELEPLRATMYCFGNQEAEDAFGWQYKECLANDPRLAHAIDTFPDNWKLPTRS